MNISPKQRFLDICHFKRLGDLCMPSTLNRFWEQTLEEWVEQGVPKEIIHPHFLNDYFQFQHIHWLTEIKSGAHSWLAVEEASATIDLGHGIAVGPRVLSPIVPHYEPRVISENER